MLERSIFVATNLHHKCAKRSAMKISRIFIGSVCSTYNDIVSITTPPKSKKTHFPVSVNGRVVYYGQKTFDVRRFEETEKYKRILKWCSYFEDDK